MNCRDEIVSFDHTHEGLFQAPKSDREKLYAGGLVRSIRCQVVDQSFEVANTNGHLSTQRQIGCPSDSCKSKFTCESYFVVSDCESGKCKRTGLAAIIQGSDVS